MKEYIAEIMLGSAFFIITAVYVAFMATHWNPSGLQPIVKPIPEATIRAACKTDLTCWSILLHQ